MKNLKKIVPAIVSAVLLVSMALGLAFAVAGEGDAEHQTNISAVQTVMNDKVLNTEVTDAVKAEGLKQVYELLTTKSFNTNEQDYKDLVGAYNQANLEFMLGKTDALVTSGLTAIMQDINKFLSDVSTLEVVIPAKPNYTGSMVTANAILAKIKSTSTNQEVKATVAELYSYLVANPVDPTLDEYPTFVEKYFNACDRVASIFEEEVNAVSSLDEKVIAITAVYEYLKATPISDGAIDKYNEVRKALIEENETMSGKLNAPEMVIPETDYTEEPTVDTAPENLFVSIESLRSALNDESKTLEDVLNQLKTTYQSVLSVKIDNATLDKDSDTYKLIWGKDDPETTDVNEDGYVALRDKVAELVFSKIDSTNKLEDKLALFETVRIYLTETPVSDYLCDEYNNRVVSLKQTCERIVEALVANDMHFNYTAEKPPVIDEETIQIYYATLNTLVDKINSAVAEEKLPLYTALFNAYKGVTILDTTAPEFLAFKSSYKTLADELAVMLLAPVDEADTPEEKLALLEKANEFLKVTYFDSSVLYKYNEKVEQVLVPDPETATDSDKKLAKSLIIKSNIIVADEYLSRLNDYKSAGNMTEFLALYKEYNAFVNRVRFYPVEENYDIFVSSDALCRDAVRATLIANVTGRESIEEKFDEIVFARDYMNDIVFDEKMVTAYETTVAVTIKSCTDAIDELASEGKLIVSLPDGLVALLDAVKEAEGIEAKKTAFTQLFNAYKASIDNKQRDWTDDSFVQFEALYKEYIVEFATELVSTVDKETTPESKYEAIVKVKDYIKSNLFSVDVITKYTEKLAELQGMNYSETVEKINENTEELSYTAIEGVVSDFTEFDALIKAVSEARKEPVVTPPDATEPDTETGDSTDTETTQKPKIQRVLEAYKAVYIYLSENKFDVFNEVFITKLVESYNSEKDLVVEDIKAEIITPEGEEAKAMTEFVEAYNLIYNFLKDDSISVSFVASYNEARKQADCFFKLGTEFDKYTADVDFLIEHKEKAGYVKDGDIPDADKEKLASIEASIKTFIENIVLARITAYDIAEYTAPSQVLLTKNTQIRRIRALLEKYPDFVSSATKNKFNLKEMNLQGLQRTAKEALESETNLFEYDWLYHAPYDGSKTFANKYNAEVASLAKKKEANGNDYMELSNGTEVGGDFYMEFKLWKLLSDSTASSLSKEPNLAKLSSNGLVLEFDMFVSENARFVFYSFEDALNESYVKKDRTDIDHFSITPDGDLCQLKQDKKDGDIVSEEVFTPNQWTHVICVFVPEKGTKNSTLTMYIDYAFAGSWTTTAYRKNVEFTTYDLTVFRVLAYNKNSTLGFDNFTIYQGTNYRTNDRFKNMTERELFEFYTDYATNESYSAENRAYAYEKAQEYLDYAKTDPSLNSHIQKLEGINYDAEILSIARAKKMSELKVLADKIDTTKPGVGAINSNSYPKFNVYVDEIEQFIKNNSTILDQSDPEIVRIRAMITEVRKACTKVASFSGLVSALEKFHRAPTLASMRTHYESVTELYDACEFNVKENYELAQNDDIIKKFLQSVNKQNPPELKEYYEVIAVEKMLAREKLENSMRILKCIEIIEEMPGYEATETFWAQNYDYIENYLSVVRSITQANNYNEEYEGISEALEKFDTIEEYFYELVQQRHLEVIKGQLDRFPTCSTYIEKKGICTYVENYIIDKDVNQSDEVFVALIRILDAYKLEVEQYEAEYADVLEANTVTFIGLVEKMNSYSSSYKNLKPLYQEAIEKYYYNMNVDSAEAKVAIEKFAVLEAKVKVAEENSSALIEAVINLNSARTDNQLYEALVECSRYVQNAEEDIDGVSDAIRIYEAKLAEYNAKIDTFNAELSEVNGVVCSARSISISSVVLAIINAIFSR